VRVFKAPQRSPTRKHAFERCWQSEVIMDDSQPDRMDGIEVSMTENTPLFTEQESRILELYDRLEELQLEIALLKAQGVLSQGEFFTCASAL
jgi:hypothetical protein